MENLLWRLFTRTDVMLSTQNATLPICWFKACPIPLGYPEMHWLDNWHRADISAFTAETCISAELSNNFQIRSETKLEIEHLGVRLKRIIAL